LPNCELVASSANPYPTWFQGTYLYGYHLFAAGARSTYRSQFTGLTSACQICRYEESVVFVGGAVISIYADDPAADEIRPTQDVDLTLKLLDFSQRELDAKLAERGFHPDIQGHAICTYKYKPRQDNLWVH
jgi:hypothetical protein